MKIMHKATLPLSHVRTDHYGFLFAERSITIVANNNKKSYKSIYGLSHSIPRRDANIYSAAGPNSAYFSRKS
jgi:hypothetical protein